MKQREYMRDLSKMRTKFNAWNSAEQKMYFNVGIDPYAEDGYVFDQNGAIDDMYGFPPTLLQFTGLLDKNGKDIYEGDILEDIWGARQEVISFIDETHALSGFTFRPVKKEAVMTPHVTYQSWLKIAEIIGNIYENKELLEVGQ